MPVAEETPHATWLNELLATMPWVLLALFLWFYIYRRLMSTQRKNDELRRARERVAELERQLSTSRCDGKLPTGGG